MLRKAIECVDVKPLRFLPDAPAQYANAVELENGRKFFLRDDGVVVGMSQDEFLKHYGVTN
jgi:hypothetical protein